ncbi:hypothetical protein ACRAWF_27480 [Streptomyces sp. L7]
MFWPEDADSCWDHAPVPGLRFREVNPLPSDEKDLRRLFRSCAHDGWSVHVVVHEAMTPDARGRLPLARLLPTSLRHCVVEHRATPDQLRSVNWALLREFDFQVPRGGAVVLPTNPAAPGYDVRDFSVRSVFLDGSEPTELVDVLCRYAASARPLPEGGAEAVTALREQWSLMTLEEELARERRLVAMYAEALEAMTKSRDLYRESADRANEALAALRESGGAVVPGGSPASTGSPLQPDLRAAAGRDEARCARHRPLRETLYRRRPTGTASNRHGTAAGQLKSGSRSASAPRKRRSPPVSRVRPVAARA